MALRYQSGEEIRKGDRVRFHRNPAEIELVATDACDPEQAWYVQEYGAGVLIVEAQLSERTFIDTNSLPDYEDLEFVSRAEDYLTAE
jgi:hypothetical protein